MMAKEYSRMRKELPLEDPPPEEHTDLMALKKRQTGEYIWASSTIGTRRIYKEQLATALENLYKQQNKPLPDEFYSGCRYYSKYSSSSE